MYRIINIWSLKPSTSSLLQFMLQNGAQSKPFASALHRFPLGFSPGSRCFPTSGRPNRSPSTCRELNMDSQLVDLKLTSIEIIKLINYSTMGPCMFMCFYVFLGCFRILYPIHIWMVTILITKRMFANRCTRYRKNIACKSNSRRSKCTIFSISGSDFVELFVGIGASRVRDMFEQGKKSAPCIIFIDHIC